MSKSPKALGIDPANVVPGSVEAIYCEAHKAAETAVTYEYVKQGGEPAFCGFAWVTVKPARGSFVSFCKKHGIGHSGTYGGWEFSLFSVYGGQSMDLKEVSCRAFATVLRSHGISCSVGSRAD